tara:strand:+ start:86 stop:1171 length:1086 start_codon:yes stop_codon:yes gene_type:complete
MTTATKTATAKTATKAVAAAPVAAAAPAPAKTNQDTAALDTARDAAGIAAKRFQDGGIEMSAGLKELGKYVAEVSDRLTDEQFRDWVAAGTPALKAELRNKNSKAELIFVGKVPDQWFAAQSERTNSPKAYQRNFNVDKIMIAEGLAEKVQRLAYDGAASGAVDPAPTAEQVNTVLVAFVDAHADMTHDADAKPHAILATEFAKNLRAQKIAKSGGVINYCAATDEKTACFEPRKTGTAYRAGTQFGAGNRAHELVAALAKALTAQLREVAEESEPAEKAPAAPKAAARKFSQFGFNEAIVHLAKILSTHSDASAIADRLFEMADDADGDAEIWAEQIAELTGLVKHDAEDDADADALDDA